MIRLTHNIARILGAVLLIIDLGEVGMNVLDEARLKSAAAWSYSLLFYGTDAFLVASPCHSDSPYSSSAGSFESLLTAASV